MKKDKLNLLWVLWAYSQFKDPYNSESLTIYEFPFWSRNQWKKYADKEGVPDDELNRKIYRHKMHDNFLAYLTQQAKESISNNLKKAMKGILNVPDSEFSTHSSDLYVIHTEKRLEWLKKWLTYPQNIVVSTSNVKGQDWYNKEFIEIPFAEL